MKNNRYIVYCLLLIFTWLVLPASAYQIFTDPISGNPGEDICVPVYLTHITDPLEIDAIGFIAEYNDQYFSYSHISSNNTLTTGFLINGKELISGEIKVVGSKFSNPVSITEDSILVNICFSINSALESESITLTEFKDDIAEANVDIPEQSEDTLITPDNEDSDIGECFIQLITVDFSVFFGNPKNCLKRSSPR